MQLEITKQCADSLRTFAQSNFGITIKSCHAHEIVAAYMGYSSRAALLADEKHSVSSLRLAEIIVLTPTDQIRERFNELDGLPKILPHTLGEGVYLPLIEDKWITQKIWPTMEYLAIALANQEWKSRPYFFRDQKIQREAIKVDSYEDGVYLKVMREYVSPSRLLNFKEGKQSVVDLYQLTRIACHIGYRVGNHFETVAETLDEAITRAATII